MKIQASSGFSFDLNQKHKQTTYIAIDADDIVFELEKSFSDIAQYFRIIKSDQVPKNAFLYKITQADYQEIKNDQSRDHRQSLNELRRKARDLKALHRRRRSTTSEREGTAETRTRVSSGTNTQERRGRSTTETRTRNAEERESVSSSTEKERRRFTREKIGINSQERTHTASYQDIKRLLREFKAFVQRSQSLENTKISQETQKIIRNYLFNGNLSCQELQQTLTEKKLSEIHVLRMSI